MDFEIARKRNIAKNEAMLLELNLEPLQPKKKSGRKPAASKKRKPAEVDENSYDDDDDDEEESTEPPKKTARVEKDATGLRRSQRNSGKKIDYKEIESTGKAHWVPRLASIQAGLKEMSTEPRIANKRIHDPQTFGAIPGIPVGTWWQTRADCSADAVHAPWVAGISGGLKGAYSVALSGGYEDDVDLGNAFTFTGSGGRDLKGTKAAPKNLRTAPQSCDQSFENSYNKALLRSCDTKKPIRVIRGYKLHSPFAPAEGYRYDGLYTVEKAWMERGLNPKGYKVCKFAFKRIEGQAPLQYGDDEDIDSDTNEGDTEDAGANSDTN
ncbi:E3 ubiquitin-protein ligase UHRF1 [Grifola frondosa]|uniref:E3 ubiquitin-protein ligase UHRF1 n=1 Tax=Grifola frondosa TaxID=5627 RepID=A0A1C7MVR0_GRIFR|nr:E3 ubiquitin-protein ligase UHRF1 [Grifola frondosa]